MSPADASTVPAVAAGAVAGDLPSPAANQALPLPDGSPGRWHRDRWVPLVLLAVVPFALLRLGLRPVDDPDTYWHIRTGRLLVDTWQFAGPDPLGRFSSRTWVLHEWLPELGLAGADAVGGLPAVAWVGCAAVAAIFVTVYVVCRHRVPVLPAAILATAVLFGSAASLTPRPQLVSFILLPVVVHAWLGTAQDLRPRWWLVPLTWVWACSHGLWLVAPVVGAAVVAGLLLDRRLTVRAARGPVACLLLGVVAAGLTPAGPELLLAPLRVGETTALVSEWAPPTVTSPPVALTLALAAAVVVVWARRGVRVPWTHVLLLATAVAWTLLYSRTVALGALTLGPLLATAWPTRPDDVQPSRRSESFALGTAVAASLAAAALVLPTVAAAPGMPNGLDPALDRLPAGTVVFNEYSLGGWMLWRHPDLAPVIDPRIEVYDTPYVEEYARALTASPGWQETVAASGARHAVLPRQAPLTAALEATGQWRVAASDGDDLLLVRDR